MRDDGVSARESSGADHVRPQSAQYQWGGRRAPAWNVEGSNDGFECSHRAPCRSIPATTSPDSRALDSGAPNRLGFDLIRMMRTNYRYDDLQRTYFVINSFEQLFEETRPDFTDYYSLVKSQAEIGEFELLPGDKIITKGTGQF